MLMSELGESMIGRHEEIVAADMVPPVERRPVSSHTYRELSLDELRPVVQCLPCPDGPTMQIQILILFRSTTERRVWL